MLHSHHVRALESQRPSSPLKLALAQSSFTQNFVLFCFEFCATNFVCLWDNNGRQHMEEVGKHARRKWSATERRRVGLHEVTWCT